MKVRQRISAVFVSLVSRLISGLMMFVLSMSTVYAIPVTWHLSGVTFDDEGVAAGSFVFDADTGSYSNINVETAGGETGQSNIYLFATSFAINGFPDFVDTSPIVPGVTANLSLALVAEMTNAGGTIDIQGPDGVGITQEGICITGDPLCTTATAFRQIARGSITTQPQVIPIPAAVWLFGSGLLGLVGMARRKKTA